MMTQRTKTHRRLLRVACATAVMTLASTGAITSGHADAAPLVASAYVGLAQGAQGDAVKAVQQRLIALGVYLADGADGVWGPGMTRGIKQFQGWNGLTQTGMLNDATVKALGLTGSSGGPAAPAATPPPAAAPVSSYVGLKQGSTGPLVKELQQALMTTGLVIRGGADGVFGPSTSSALRAFQGFNGLSKTGVLNERGASLLKLGTGSVAPPAAPPAASAYLGLKLGSGGRKVVDLQKALIAAGVTVRGGPDGAFGSATAKALLTYQAGVGIAQSAVVDQATIDKLGLGLGRGPVGFAPPSNPPATPTNSYVGLKAGSSGPLVTELQWALLGTGLVIRGGADGSFGASTTSALKAFQSVNGIAQTGVVTERDVALMGLGTGKVKPVTTPPPSGGSVTLARFPVQGQCYFGDTWHAPRGGGRKHEGVDIIAAEGKLLYAVVDGTVSKLYWDQPGALSGNGLRIEQPNGTYFTYLHLLSFAPGVTVGTQVKAGDVIGFVGTTGSSATPHLHFEIHPNGGGAVNPYPYVKAIDECGNTTPRYQGSFT
jgi:peptidoglycan hydrolase-like protein with peptidoglycan-binding domain